MDPHDLSVAQLKEILRDYNLPTSGRKVELIGRMQKVDPTGAWIQEAARRCETEVEREDALQEAGAATTDALQEAGAATTDSPIPAGEDSWMRRELTMITRERDLMQRETDLLRRENELLRQSSRSSVASSTTRMMSIKEVSSLLCEYKGTGEDFKRWKAQVNLLRQTYDLDENASKVLVGSKLRDKAADWYFSLSDHLTLRVDDLLEKMSRMFDQPLGKRERRQIAEARKWKKGESFNDYCHDKVIVGYRVPVDEDETIDFIIDGIPSSTLKNQARMHRFTAIHELCEAFRLIKLEDAGSLIGRQEYAGMKPRQTITKNTSPKKDDMYKPRANSSSEVRCYGCDQPGHYLKDCPQKKAINKTSSEQRKITRVPLDNKKKADRQLALVDEAGDEGQQSSGGGESDGESGDNFEEEGIHLIDITDELRDEFRRDVELQILGGTQGSCTAQIDTGCPVTLVKEQLINAESMEVPDKQWNRYRGINNSKLRVKGVAKVEIAIDGQKKLIKVGVVPSDTMSVPLLLGRDALRLFGYRLTNSPAYDRAISEIMSIDSQRDTQVERMNVNPKVDAKCRDEFVNVIQSFYYRPERPEFPKIRIEATLTIKDNKLIQFGPRRLGFAEKEKVQEILSDLLKRGIIQASTSEYASPIVLTKKKNGETRMCIDYRALNKVLARDNYPLPLIEDQLDTLRDKKYYSTLDLKDGFYHVAMAPESIKYTSFVTPLGQFEFVRMPFGLKIGPQLFQRFINEIMVDLIRKGAVVVYMDDILVASETLDQHIKILKQVFTTLVQNKLELRMEKCAFLYTEIEYLGYKITHEGIRPTDKGIKAIQDFPEPKTVKEVHSFVGLASYFRKFVKGFSLIAQPLYRLLKKDVSFEFGQVERNAFETLKAKLMEPPILAVYNIAAYTELHCDASSHGFGAVLMQRQSNGVIHPVFYFSRRTTEAEAKYHSFELETLAIVYACRRFRIYLQGIEFVIISDCNAVTQTLEKRDINARIARWSLELQNFNFKVVHRPGSRMGHVDALSRSFGVLVVEDNPFEWNLTVSQGRDPVIKEIVARLESTDDPQYEMRNGLAYKKHGGKSLFMIPRQMESHVLFRYHNEMGHLGAGKMIDAIRCTYWFPRVREKCEEHVRNCLKCISFSPVVGRSEGYLNPIPKEKIPFETLHIDHFGPVDRHVSLRKHIFVIVDAFSKYIRLFATKNTGAKEAITCLKHFFQSYNKPHRIISDRGSAFTSQEFEEFIKEQDIQHIKVAVGAPQANGQVERINRVIAPCIAKLSDHKSGRHWYKVLHEIEYSINNTVNRSTGKTPSQLVFGMDQRGPCVDRLREFLEEQLDPPDRDLEAVRDAAAQQTCRSQQQQKAAYDKRHKTPKQYGKGDFVMVRNFDSTLGASRKLLPQFRGPYEIAKALRNNRYVVADIPGFQNTQKLYQGVWDVSNLRPWTSPKDLASD